jgi:hypothetical protein
MRPLVSSSILLRQQRPQPSHRLSHSPKPRLAERFKHFLLDLDARLDFGLFRGGLLAREGFERYRDFMDRYHGPHRGHHAKVSTAAAQGPKQVCFVSVA